MKKRIQQFIFALLCIPLVCIFAAAQTVTVSGTNLTMGPSGPLPGSNNDFVIFRLKNWQGNLPRVLGVGTITQLVYQVIPNVSGVFITTLYGNDQIIPANTYYSFEQWHDGKMQSSANYQFCTNSSCAQGAAAQCPCSLATQPPLNPAPASPLNVAPLLTLNNIWTGTNTFGGASIFNGPVNLNGSVTGFSLLTNAGDFTATAYRCYFCSDIGGFVFTSLPTYGANKYVDTLAGGCTLPNTASLSLFGCNGVSGYVISNADSRNGGSNPGQTDNVASFFGVSVCNVNNAGCWGINTATDDNGTQTGTFMVGYEMDFGVGGTPATGYGITENFGTTSTGSLANVVGLNIGTKAFSGSQKALLQAIAIGDGAATNGMQFGVSNPVGANTGSANANFCWWDGTYPTLSGRHCDNFIFADGSGNLKLLAHNGQSIILSQAIVGSLGATLSSGGLTLSTAASANGISLAPLAVGASQPSNAINFSGTNGASTPVVGKINLDLNGNLLISPNGSAATVIGTAASGGGLFIPNTTSGGFSILPQTTGSFTQTLAPVTGKIGVTGNATTGFYQSVKNTAGCTTPATIGNSCATPVTVTWPVSFGDTNYSVTCTPSSPGNLPGTPYVVVKSNGSFTLNYFALSNAAATWTTIDCTGIHD